MSLGAALTLLFLSLLCCGFSFMFGRDSGQKGKRVSGVILSALLGAFAYTVISQGFEDVWPKAVGIITFAAGALNSLIETRVEKPNDQ